MSGFIKDIIRMGEKITKDKEIITALIDSICYEYGGTQVYIGKLSSQKKLERNEWIIKQYNAGESVSAIAARTKLTIRRVRGIVSEAPSLFPD